ncbi:MAG: DUF308 domain-containing protein [Bacilli bacterium]|nr:DUF308 domain-containing protein [Bacilli bacterium]
METLMKKFFRSSLITSVFLMVLGGLLLFKSEETIITIAYIIGGALFALGVVALIRFIRYARKEVNSELDIIYGVVTIILGYLIIKNPKSLASIIPIVLGVSIVISSATKLQYALELKRDQNQLWTMTLIVAIISAICGAALIINPFAGAEMITQIVGGFIIAYAILDIVSTMTIKRNVTTLSRAIQQTVKEADIIEEEDK